MGVADDILDRDVEKVGETFVGADVAAIAVLEENQRGRGIEHDLQFTGFVLQLRFDLMQLARALFNHLLLIGEDVVIVVDQVLVFRAAEGQLVAEMFDLRFKAPDLAMQGIFIVGSGHFTASLVRSSRG